MRRARIKAEGADYYHCMSRIIERRHILKDREKQRPFSLMRSLAAFGGLEILTYCFMSSHFHILMWKSGPVVPPILSQVQPPRV